MPITSTTGSIYSDILAAVDVSIANLGLAYTPQGTTNTVNATVVLRKLPRVEESLGDALPLIAICPQDRPELVRPASAEAESGIFKDYLVEVVVIAPGNQDFVSNIPAYFSWRETIMRAFQDPIPSTGTPPKPLNIYGLYDTEIRPEIPIDRSRVNQNYDYMGIGIVFKCIEPRNNVAAQAIGAP